MDTVSKVTPAGVVSTFASGFVEPFGLAFDAAGNLYVANSDDDTVSEVTPAGVVSTFVSGLSGPVGLAFDAAGNLYVTNRQQHGERGDARGRGQHLRLRVRRTRRPGLRRRQPLRRQHQCDITLSTDVVPDLSPCRLRSAAVPTSGVAFSGVTAGPLLFGLGQTTVDITGTLIHDPGPGRTLTFTLGTPVGRPPWAVPRRTR